MNIIDRLQGEYSTLTKAQKIVAEYVINNLLSVSFMTVNQLANSIGTSTTTIIRLANHFGYSGYSDFQAALQEMITNNPPSQNLANWNANVENSDSVISEVLKMECINMQETSRLLNSTTIHRAADVILQVRQLFIVGDRGSYSASYFLYRNLERMLGKCIMLGQTPDTATSLARIQPGDALIAVSVPRYLNNSSRIVPIAKRFGATVISITGEHNSPLAPFSDIMLPVTAKSGSYFRTAMPSMLISEVLVSVIAYRIASNAKSRLEMIEELERTDGFVGY